MQKFADARVVLDYQDAFFAFFLRVQIIVLRPADVLPRKRGWLPWRLLVFVVDERGSPRKTKTSFEA